MLGVGEGQEVGRKREEGGSGGPGKGEERKGVEESGRRGTEEGEMVMTGEGGEGEIA